MLKGIFSKAHRNSTASIHTGSKDEQVMHKPETGRVSAANTFNPIIGVLGVKGGVGTTTLSLNLAQSLSRVGNQVTLLDANLQQPDVATLLGKKPEFSLVELLSRGSDIDKEVFEACLVKADEEPAAIQILSPPMSGDGALRTNLSQLSELLSAIRSYSSLWVIDLPRTLDRHLVTMLDKCNHLVVVFEPTLACTAALKRWMKVFEELSYPSEKILFALNRTGGKYKTVEQAVVDQLSGDSLFKIPNDYIHVERALSQGIIPQKLFPNRPMAKATDKLAENIVRHFPNDIPRLDAVYGLKSQSLPQST